MKTTRTKNDPMPNPITFFKTNSKTQEKFAEYSFLKDLILQAAKANQTVAISRSDFDSFGFDVLIKMDNTFYPIQMKAFNGKAANWDIHKSLLLNNGRIVLVQLSMEEDRISIRYFMFQNKHRETALARLPKISHPDKCMVRRGEFKDITTDLLQLFENEKP